MTVQIRNARADEDWATLHHLLTGAFAFMEGRIDPPSSLHNLTPADLAARAQREIAMVGHGPGDLVLCGFMEMRAHCLYLSKIAVAPAYRGRGYARRLIHAAEAIARSNSLPALELQTRIELTENHAAFAAMGFAKTGETTHPGFTRPTSITMRRPVDIVGDSP